MIALGLALALAFAPGPDDPVCEQGQTVEVDHCAQGQLAGETTGRALDAPASVPATTPAQPVRVLAATGVPTGPYVLAGTALLLVGGVLVRVRVRHVTPRG